MAATYVQHEQMHERPGLSYFLISMVVGLPVVLAILAYVFSFKGANV
jgi:hypothetical protein